MYCCWINDEGKEVLASLFNLASQYYGPEANRLIQQICGAPPALSGSNCFLVTRNLCLQFKWFSWITVYSIVASFSIFCLGALYFAQFIREVLDFGHLVSVIFNTCQAIGYMLFIRVAAQWFSLNKAWLEMEVAMKKYDRPPNDARRFKITTVVLMLMALVEHVLCNYSIFQRSHNCPGYQKDPLKAYFAVCCAEIPVVLSTFHWTFIDLFIIIISAALAERFRQLNRVVLRSPVAVKDAFFWREIREDYTRLWTLTRTVDRSVCHLITLSFGSNLFFICWQMFNSLKPMKGVAETVYFFLSFGYLLARTATVSVYCCWINDEGKEMLLSLFNLPSEYYGTEASRLIQQICAMPPALTGSNYFAVTRGLCLQIKPNHSVIVVSPDRAVDMVKKTPAQRAQHQVSADRRKSSFYRAIGPVLIMSQCFGLMPVNGIMRRDITYIHFKWLSPKMFYCLSAIIGAVVTTVLYFIQFINYDKQFPDIVNIVFFSSSAICGVLFIKLARAWLSLNEKWLSMELAMRNCPFQPNITRRLWITTVVIMSLALVEHVLSIVRNWSRSLHCPSASTDPVKTYFGVSFSHAFLYVSYSGWISFFMEVGIILATFSWNFSDLFVILMCSSLAERFKQLNRKVYHAKVKNEQFWKEVREDYTRLAMLCKSLDNAISHLVTLSFGNNLFFICVQLFNTLKPLKGLVNTIYFVCSFGFVLGRTAALSVYCCWINDESKNILGNLFEVPSEDYGTEASRLIQQIAYCPVVITGSNYFAVTRGLCLQVAGAIITFELILVQLGPILLKTDKDETLFCL
ncbi:Gustatory receptor 64e [Carabus blaptoides fortunei]